MSYTQALLSEAEVHGLVDGRLDGDKRSDVLRRLAASPADRQRVEAWQDQNELIRSAFASIEKEPLPVALIPTTPSVSAIAPGDLPIKAAVPAPARFRMAASVAAVFIVAFGLGGLWLMLETGDRNEPSSRLTLRSSLDDTLADRADAALDRETAAAAPAAAAIDALPTTDIPDLSAAGFAFASAEASVSEPPALLFHYRNAAAERVVVGVSRAPRSPEAPGEEPVRGGTTPWPVAKTVKWQRGPNTYAIVGTVAPDQLRVIAALLDESTARPRH